MDTLFLLFDILSPFLSANINWYKCVKKVTSPKIVTSSKKVTSPKKVNNPKKVTSPKKSE